MALVSNIGMLENTKMALEHERGIVISSLAAKRAGESNDYRYRARFAKAAGVSVILTGGPSWRALATSYNLRRSKCRRPASVNRLS